MERLPGYLEWEFSSLASVVKNVFTCHVDVEGGHCGGIWRIWILIVCTGNSACAEQKIQRHSKRKVVAAMP